MQPLSPADKGDLDVFMPVNSSASPGATNTLVYQNVCPPSRSPGLNSRVPGHPVVNADKNKAPSIYQNIGPNNVPVNDSLSSTPSVGAHKAAKHSVIECLPPSLPPSNDSVPLATTVVLQPKKPAATALSHSTDLLHAPKRKSVKYVYYLLDGIHSIYVNYTCCNVIVV